LKRKKASRKITNQTTFYKPRNLSNLNLSPYSLSNVPMLDKYMEYVCTPRVFEEKRTQIQHKASLYCTGTALSCRIGWSLPATK
jgi:hypothetical protein